MHALCVSGAVNTQGFVLIFLNFYALYINFQFIHSYHRTGGWAALAKVHVSALT